MFVRKVRSNCSEEISVTSSFGCCSAALLTSTSMPPKRSTTCWTALRQNCSSPTSPAMVRLAPPFVADQFRRAARVLRLVEIEDGDVRALAREQDRDSLADAAVATRHDGRFPGQSV